MKKIRDMLRWFVYITPCVLLMVAIVLALSGSRQISVLVLWQVLFSGFATALVTVFLLPDDTKPRNEFLLSCIPHYIGLCIIMVVFGMWFGWMQFSVVNVLIMCAEVAAVYASVFGISLAMGKKESDEMNSRLKEKYSEKKEE